MASAIDLLMCVVKNCLSLCCSSVHFYFDLESFEEKGSRQEKKQMVGTLVLDPLPPPRSSGQPSALRTMTKPKTNGQKRRRRGWAMMEIKHNTCLETNNYLMHHILCTCLNDKKNDKKDD